MTETAVALLICGEQKGTAFFLSARVGVTAKHCIVSHLADPSVPIELVVGAQRLQAKLSLPIVPESEDVAFLELSEPVSDELILTASATNIPTGTEWHCYGYPSAFEENLGRFGGRVALTQLAESSTWDVQLAFEGPIPALNDFSGLSGAPIITDGTVVGLIQQQVGGGTLVGVSFSRLRRFLQLAGVDYLAAENREPVPLWLSPQLENYIANGRANWLLEESIAKMDAGYVVLEGLPGSGKSLFSATFGTADGALTVLGRYFTTGDPSYSLQHHLDPKVFAAWLSTQSAFYTNEAEAVTSKDGVGKSIAGNLSALSRYCLLEGRKGVIIIDGLEIPEGSGQNFAQFLPSSLPRNIILVITTTNAGQLSHHGIIADDSLSMPPLTQYECEMLSESLQPSLELHRKLDCIEKSNGHPLLLTFLLRETASTVGGGLAAELSSFKSLEMYYEKLYSRISRRGSSIWILATVANLRYGMDESELVKTLPPDEQAGFLESITEIKHLLDPNFGEIRLYHQSLVDFVRSKTEQIHDTIHERLTTYCHRYSTDYAKTNLIHHSLRSGQSNGAMACATQQYFDAAALVFAPPELLLADLTELIVTRFEAGAFIDAISLLLLRARIRFRYDQLFAVSAVELAELAVQLGKRKQALSFVARQDFCICSPTECAALVRNLFINNDSESAHRFFRWLRPMLWAQYEKEGSMSTSSLSAHLEMAALLGEYQSDVNRILQIITQSTSDDPSTELGGSFIRGNAYGQLLWLTGKLPAPGPRSVTDCAQAVQYAEELHRSHGVKGLVVVDPSADRDLWETKVLVEEFGSRMDLSRLAPEAAHLVARMFIKHSGNRVWAKSSWAIANKSKSYSVRKPNGVDADVRSLNELFGAAEASGFCDSAELLGTPSFLVRHSWERRFLDAMCWMGKFSGKQLLRLATGERCHDTLDILQEKFLNSFSFQLADRAGWEDSYFIPELAAQAVYRQAAKLISTFQPEAAHNFLDLVAAKAGVQLGVYSEGYTGILAIMAEELAVASASRTSALRLWSECYAFVAAAVFARRERVGYLLECATNFARLGDTELALEAFREALSASLGPDWYKESQFSLITDVMSADPEGVSLGEVWREALEVLELASGECTFQRYVRYQKHDLISALAAQGNWSAAVGLIIHYLVGSPEIQLARLERTPNDRISAVKTGRFGVAEIEEQAAIAGIIASMPDDQSHRKWALLELALPLDSRRISDLGRHLDLLLQSQAGASFSDRFLRLLRMDVAPDRRQQLCEELVECKGSAFVVHELLNRAVALGMIKPFAKSTNSKTDPAPINHDGDELFLPGTFGKRSAREELQNSHDEAIKLIGRRQGTLARRKLVAGLLAYQLDGWSVWLGSELGQSSLDLLFSAGSLEETTKAILPLIVNEKFCLDWQLASCLAQRASESMSNSERKAAGLVFTAHLRTILLPELNHIPVSETEKSVVIPDLAKLEDCIDFLLINLLDHPDEYFRARVADVIRWLTTSGSFSLEMLESRAQSLPHSWGRELATGILQNVRNPGLLNSTPCQPPSSEVVELNLLVAKSLGLSNPPSQPTAQASEEPLEPWLLPIGRLLFGDPELIASANAELTKVCSPLKPPISRELYEVSRRALGQPSTLKGTPQEREALFRVASRLDEAKQREVIESLASWNPKWPHDLLDVGISESLIDVAVANVKGSVQQPFLFANGTLLHAVEIIAEPSRRISQQELIAFFVKYGRDLSPPRLDQLTQRGSLHFSVCHPCPPRAVVRSYPLGATAGGVLTPSTVSDLFMGSGPFSIEFVRRLFWQNGRATVPRLGDPLSQGCALFYDFKEAYEAELGWLFLRDGITRALVYPKRKVVQYYGGDR